MPLPGKASSHLATDLAWPEPEPLESIDLDDLIRFLQHPMQWFLRNRMGIYVPQAGETPDDTLPANLDALSSWSVKDRLLDGMTDGYDLDELSDPGTRRRRAAARCARRR